MHAHSAPRYSSELREMVSDYGFEKEDVDEDAPQWRKADVTRFLELYRVESVNAFKARFAAEKLQPPSRVKAAPGATPSAPFCVAAYMVVRLNC